MNLLLLTHNFPFMPGEQFLEGEIEILSLHFHKITIVPLNPAIEPNATARVVPGNVELVDLPGVRGRTWANLPATWIFTGLRDIVCAMIDARIASPSKLRRVLSQYLTSAAVAMAISRQVSLGDFAVAYSYWGAENGLVLCLLKRCSPLLTRYVARLHGYDLYAEREGLKRLPFQRQLLATCDLVAPCSIQGEQYLRANYGPRADKVRHFHLGVAPQDFLNLGSTDGILRVVTCSYVVPVKRLELVIYALRSVKRKVIWTHIGDGPQFAYIARLSAELSSHIRPVFLGHLQNSEVINFYRENPVDIFLNVSSYEGVPVSIMEATSFGIEPIVTDVGGVAELVRPEFGTLLPVDFTPAQLAAIIQNYNVSGERRVKAQSFQRSSFSFENYDRFTRIMLALTKEDA